MASIFYTCAVRAYRFTGFRENVCHARRGRGVRDTVSEPRGCAERRDRRRPCRINVGRFARIAPRAAAAAARPVTLTPAAVLNTVPVTKYYKMLYANARAGPRVNDDRFS